MPQLVKNLGLLALFIVVAGCTSLKKVSEFSNSSIDGIQKYEEISTSFSKICLENCEHQKIEALKIHGTDCDCSNDVKADSITRLIYLTIQNYFYSLRDISNNEITSYHTDELGQALTSGNFGTVQLKEKDVEAFSGISTLIFNAFADGYRSKKVKGYVRTGDAHLQILLHFLNTNLAGNLQGKLEVQKSTLKNYYFDHVADKTLSVYERTKFAEDYFKRIAGINEKQKELEAYSEILRTISTAHTSLNANIDNLEADEIGRLLENYGNVLYKASTPFR